MEDALKLIIAKSPNAADEAIRTLAALRNNSPIVQIRYLNVLQRALADPQAVWTAKDRELMAGAVEISEGQTRDFTVRVRLTNAEHIELQAAADGADLSVSEYIRRKIFL